MGKVHKGYFKISDTIIEISSDFPNGGEVVDFVKRDFRSVATDECSTPDICVSIVDDYLEIPQSSSQLGSSIIAFDDKIAFRHEARFRETWVTYSMRPYLGKYMTIHIPRELFMTRKTWALKESMFR